MNARTRIARHTLALAALALTASTTLLGSGRAAEDEAATLRLNTLEYLEMPGLDVMLAHDYYPEGHQGGVGIIQNGQRVATNGDIRLDRTPGQWSPIPKVIGRREVDRASGEIRLRMAYPDESRDRKGFNPIAYPDLRFAYTVRVRPQGRAFRILVDLDEPLPERWIGMYVVRYGDVSSSPFRIGADVFSRCLPLPVATDGVRPRRGTTDYVFLVLADRLLNAPAER
jgi:endoglucanase